MTPDLLAALILEERLLHAEVQLAEVNGGWTVADATRELFPWERAAAVRFATLDRQVEEVAEQLLSHARTVREAVVEALAGLAVGSRIELLAFLRNLADPTTEATLAGIPDVIDATTAAALDDLLTAADRAAAEVVDEARRQGVSDALLPTLAALPDDQRRALELTARRVAVRPYALALDVAQEVAQRESAGPGPVDDARALVAGAVEASSEAQLVDVTRQAAGEAQAAGRTYAARQAPEPAEVYASELMDRNTCGPCSDVDGRRYDTLAHALEDYPGAGGFVFCEGGARCRGTLVFVHESEAAPTLGGGRRGEGPSDPPPERPYRLP